jgi:hypothetical protein
MTENEAQCLITCSEELLQVVRHAKEANFEPLLAGDEPWFHYEDPLIRLGFHRESLFGVERYRKFRPKMSGFDYLVDVQHPQFSCFACRDAVRCGVVLCIYSA